MKTRIILVLITLSVLALYMSGLRNPLYWDDAGEFMTASFTMGISHSPGHPLFILIGRFFTLLMGGTGNSWLLFPLLASIFAVFLMSSNLEKEISLSSAFFAVMLFTNPYLAMNSLQGEVYSLHFLLICIIYITILKKNFLAFCYFTGLSLCNNPSHIFTLPVLLIPFKKELKDLRKLTTGSVLFLAAMTLYIYIPIRSVQNPELNWMTPDNLRDFLNLTLAREFSSKLTGHSLNKEGFVNALISKGWFPLGLIFAFLIAFIGIFVKRGLKAGKSSSFHGSGNIFFALSLLFIHLFTSLYFWGNSLALDAYLIPVYGLAVYITIFGLKNIANRFAISEKYYYAVLLIIMFSMIYKTEYVKTTSSPELYARKNLSEIPFKGLLATENSIVYFGCTYMKHVKGMRKDADLLYIPYRKYRFQKEPYNAFTDKIMKKNLNYLIRYNPSDLFIIKASFLKPSGLLHRIDSSEFNDFDVAYHKRKLLELKEHLDFSEDKVARRRLMLLITQSGTIYYSRDKFREALEMYEDALEIEPSDSSIRKNIGIIKRELSKPNTNHS
ncbi:MAG: DUF2723 domain-containing protein [Candidatus Coatesbacteria bacterium]|nr:DUF2723 domain-containing protein [Candidatus Coatesbacteria bacterium]